MSRIKYIIGGVSPSQLESILAQIKSGNNNGVLVLRDPVPQEVIEINLLDEVKTISFGEFIRKFVDELPDEDE